MNVRFISNVSYLLNVYKKHKEKRALIAATATIILSVIVAVLMTAPTGAVMTNEQPATAAALSQPVSYIPNPVMTSNITWSTFYHGWNPLEYSNGSANLTLNAKLNPAYGNPISVNPTDILAAGTLQGEPLYTGGKDWNGSLSTASTPTGGSIAKTGAGTANGEPTAYVEENTSASASNVLAAVTTIGMLESNLPSANLQYDYITAVIGVSATTAVTGAYGLFYISNSSGVSSFPITKNGSVENRTTNPATATPITAGQEEFISFPLSALSDTAANFNISESNTITLKIGLSLPKSTTASTYNISLYGLALTETPLTLGTALNGNNQEQTEAAVGSGISLNSLSPNFQYSEITNHGYTVAVTQTLQNSSESQSAISGGNYIEQATYQGIFSLPTAPDLTYSNSVIQMNLTTPGSQYEVANLNGISYLSSIQSKNNGTFVFATVNPNQQNSLILEIEFTASQWNASTAAPSFFSIAGIEYYWWVGVIGLLSIVGLGAAASSHFSGEEENLKVPKGKFGR